MRSVRTATVARGRREAVAVMDRIVVNMVLVYGYQKGDVQYPMVVSLYNPARSIQAKHLRDVSDQPIQQRQNSRLGAPRITSSRVAGV